MVRSSCFAMRFVDISKDTAREIQNGDVCYKFTRPINLYNQWFAENWGHKLSATILRSPLIIIIALLLPSSIGLMLPISFPAFILFLISLILGSMMMSAIAMIAVALIFKTASPKGVVSLVHTISGLLGGLFIPLPLMPQSIQNVINFLPFRFVTDLPLRIYIGNVSIMSGLMYIGIAIAWLIALISLGQLLIKMVCKKAIIQGG
ncbi:MAG: ABC-2 family transporter protein [Clostridia bacterium]|nr:ABC-2 family transporter protein [Clostridia bacterium]